MTALRRHQLLRLTQAGWAAVLARPWDAQARDCLAHWAAHALPLVVTRQPVDVVQQGGIALGLPAPARWGRRRLALQVPHAAVLRRDDFPRSDAAMALVGSRSRAALETLTLDLREQRATARVFGSHGWQLLTGLGYLHPGSDLDLWVAVDDMAHADAVTSSLQAFTAEHPRLDGELVFGDGSAVAWREWADWRAGTARAVMVKHLQGVSLRRDIAWCGGAGKPVASE